MRSGCLFYAEVYLSVLPVHQYFAEDVEKFYCPKGLNVLEGYHQIVL